MDNRRIAKEQFIRKCIDLGINPDEARKLYAMPRATLTIKKNPGRVYILKLNDHDLLRIIKDVLGRISAMTNHKFDSNELDMIVSAFQRSISYYNSEVEIRDFKMADKL